MPQLRVTSTPGSLLLAADLAYDVGIEGDDDGFIALWKGMYKSRIPDSVTVLHLMQFDLLAVTGATEQEPCRAISG